MKKLLGASVSRLSAHMFLIGFAASVGVASDSEATQQRRQGRERAQRAPAVEWIEPQVFDVTGNWSLSGDLGVGTDAQTTEIHVVDEDTPILRLEQDGTLFEPQTYDVGSWEFGFFVDDVTAGTTPFEIDVGAPSGSVFVAGGSGDVGFGTTTPSAPVHILRSTGEPNIRLQTLAAAGVRFELVNMGGEWEFIHGPGGGFNFNRVGVAGNQFIFTPIGNLVIQGTLTQGSSRDTKHDFGPIDSREILSKVAELPLSTWTYKTDTARHVGPMAEDFRSVFGLGMDEKHLAPGDVAGVALAAIQGLNETVTELNETLKEKDERITALEQEMAELRALLARIPVTEQ